MTLEPNNTPDPGGIPDELPDAEAPAIDPADVDDASRSDNGPAPADDPTVPEAPDNAPVPE